MASVTPSGHVNVPLTSNCSEAVATPLLLELDDELLAELVDDDELGLLLDELDTLDVLELLRVLVLDDDGLDDDDRELVLLLDDAELVELLDRVDVLNELSPDCVLTELVELIEELLSDEVLLDDSVLLLRLLVLLLRELRLVVELDELLMVELLALEVLLLTDSTDSVLVLVDELGDDWLLVLDALDVLVLDRLDVLDDPDWLDSSMSCRPHTRIEYVTSPLLALSRMKHDDAVTGNASPSGLCIIKTVWPVAPPLLAESVGTHAILLAGSVPLTSSLPLPPVCQMASVVISASTMFRPSASLPSPAPRS